MSRSLQGTSAAPGCACGPAWLAPDSFSHREQSHGPQDLAQAVARVDRALAREARAHPGQADLLFAHRQMLHDPMLLDEAMRLAAAGMEAGQAWEQAAAALEQMLEGLDDETLRARAADLRELVDRVQRALAGVHSRPMPAGVVVMARELAPALVLRAARRGAVGLAAETGSTRSHGCLLARSLGLPAVVGLTGLLAAVEPGGQVLVDGTRGRLVIAPGSRLRQRGRTSRAEPDPEPARTRAGQLVPVVCNVATLEEVRVAAELGADGVGVFRTEHLFAGRQHPPPAAQQESCYRRAVAVMGARPVTVRLLDAGGDKPLPFLRPDREANPALGWRGLRSLLTRPRLFAAQVTAILRSGAHGLLLPMVTTAAELARARELIATCERKVGRSCQVGVMIEVPAAALAAAELAAGCDFLSIGSNDLFQYTFAADRTHARLADHYSPLEPAFLRLLAGIAEAGQARGRPVHLCGELASDARLASLWLGLGITELSVRPPCVAAVKRAVRNSGAEAGELARAAQACASAAQVAKLLEKQA